MTTYSSPVPVGCRPTSGFRTKARPTHAGDDYAPPVPGQTNIPIFAVANGTVKRTGRNILAGHSGLAVMLDHGIHKDQYGADKMESYYGHLAAFTVKPGDPVRAGQRIGTMGTTGNSTAIHVHLGVLCNGAFIDPSEWLGRKGVTVGKSAPVVAVKPQVYVVRPGDALSLIAKRNNKTVAALMKLNPAIRDKDEIAIGQKIKLS